MNILKAGDVVDPQHLQFQFTDPNGVRHQTTVYTGLLRVEHGTGGDLTPLEVQFPLVGLFGTPPGTSWWRLGRIRSCLRSPDWVSSRGCGARVRRRA